MNFFFYSLKDSILSDWMSVYVVHFNLQISSTSTANLFNK